MIIRSRMSCRTSHGAVPWLVYFTPTFILPLQGGGPDSQSSLQGGGNEKRINAALKGETKKEVIPHGRGNNRRVYASLPGNGPLTRYKVLNFRVKG
jgi:hypothetical protein